LTLRFNGRSVVLYTSYNLSESKAKYLADAKELGLFLTDEESDFTAFDEKVDPDAVSQKILVGQSWRWVVCCISLFRPLTRRRSPAETFPLELAAENICESPVEESEAEQMPVLEAGVAKKKARRGARGKSSNRRRGGKDLRAAEGDAKLAKDKKLRERALKKGNAHRIAEFSVAQDSLYASTGWQGREPPKEERDWVLKSYESGHIKIALANFHPVGCDL
jgi:hypothetical protein